METSPMTAAEGIVQAVYIAIAIPLLAGLCAVGVVLGIKIARRRQPPAPPGIASLVPARPMSARHARRLWRRYLWAVVAIVTALMVAGLALLANAG